MPHTSNRKKRSNAQKRAEVTGDDGWTRITTKSQSDKPSMTRAVSGRDHRTSRTPSKEPYAGVNVPSEQLEAPPDASVETVVRRYEMVKKLWLASEAFAALQAAFKTHLSLMHKVQSCAVFGTGSFCGLRQGWIGRHEVALLQTAVFESAVDLIEQVQGSRPDCYAQEPQYNSVDKDFLSTLQITALSDPGAFEKIALHSFVYAPGAEPAVLLRILHLAPDFLLSSEVGLYFRENEGVAHPRSERPKQAALLPAASEVSESDYENDSRACERFLHGHDSVRLPDLDLANHPFHQQLFYYGTEKAEA